MLNAYINFTNIRHGSDDSKKSRIKQNGLVNIWVDVIKTIYMYVYIYI